MAKSLKSVLIVFVLSLIIQSCKSDPASSSDVTLKSQNPIQLPKQNYFYSVDFSDESTGWAVGKDGVIYKTSDGGRNWGSQTSGTADDLFKVKFFNAQTGWAAGKNCVLFTSDGGKTWQTKLSNVPFDKFVNICFTDAGTGWIAGSPDGKIYHTSDFGATWVVQRIDTTGRVTALSFANSSTGYAFNNVRGLYRTTDGGQQWNKINTPRFCETVFALDPQFAIAGNNIMPSSLGNDQAGIFISTDGGNSWTSQSIPKAAAVWNVAAVNDQIAFAISGALGSPTGNAADWIKCGALLYTVNGGKDWKVMGNDLSGKSIIDFKIISKSKLCILTLDGQVYFADIP